MDILCLLLVNLLENSLGVDNEILMRYISENLGGIIPEQYKQIENRILKTDGKDINSKNYSDDLSGSIIAIIIVVPIMTVIIIVAIVLILKKIRSNKVKGLIKVPQNFN